MRIKLLKDINLTDMPKGLARVQRAGAVLDLPDGLCERMVDAGEAELYEPEPEPEEIEEETRGRGRKHR